MTELMRLGQRLSNGDSFAHSSSPIPNEGNISECLEMSWVMETRGKGSIYIWI